jgi:capsule polysaccharide export protein KpsE/RkpR
MSNRRARRDFAYREPELDPELMIPPESGDFARLRRVAKIALLWRERRFLLQCMAWGFLVSSVFIFLIPVRYESTTELMPPDQVGAGLASTLAALTKGGSSSSGGDLGMIGTELLGLRTSSDLFMGVLQSRSVEDDLINKFDLRRLYGDKRIEDARKDLSSRTDITSDRKSGIVTIKVSDHDPKRAAAMGREYVAQLNQIVVTLNTSAAHKERVFLETRLGQVQQDLEAAEKDFGQFASQKTALDVKEQGRAMLGAEAELEGQLIASQTQLEGLRQIYTDENVRVRSLLARIEEYKRQLRKLNGNADTGSDGSGTGQNSDQDLFPTIRQLPILGVTWADLYRRTKVQEVVFETLTKQFEIAKVEEARETPSVKVLDAADIPEKKSFPPRMILILSATLLVMVLGSVWVLQRERWRRLDARDPAKILAGDVANSIRRTKWFSRTLRFVKNGKTPGITIQKPGASSAQDSANHDTNE